MAGTALKKAAKKAAKKAPKKAAKKAAKKSAAHEAGKDLRRAYEHISRVRILHLGLRPEVLKDIDQLSRMAQGALASDDAKSAAELLRAAEHLAFGSLASARPDEGVSAELSNAASREYEKLVERSEERVAERGKMPAELREVHQTMLQLAEQARDAEALHRALEFARGAEALTHAEVSARKKLPAGRSELRLR